MGIRQAELLRRARLAAEVARRIGVSPEPLDGSAEPILCDLYRQSIHWSLQALSTDDTPQADVSEAARSTAGLWRGVDPALLLKATSNPDALASVEHAVTALTFQDFAALALEERARLLGALRGVATALIAELDVPERVVVALWLQRLLRLGLLLVLLVLAVVVVAKIRDHAEARRDLALGKPWRTSLILLAAAIPRIKTARTLQTTSSTRSRRQVLGSSSTWDRPNAFRRCGSTTAETAARSVHRRCWSRSAMTNKSGRWWRAMKACSGHGS